MRLSASTVDSALGRWTLHAWDPPHLPPSLASVVSGMWHFDGRVALRRERTFPGGYLELIVHLGPRFRPVDVGVAGEPSAGGPSAGDPFPVARLTGVQVGPLVVEAPPGACRVLGVRLTPVGAYALLAGPLDATAALGEPRRARLTTAGAGEGGRFSKTAWRRAVICRGFRRPPPYHP
ncbi:hypothetical protein tb265_43340 [Gemmatimonadetes bacterium T265]|nr:hypothetical protein tb265_43340 [Gemmatimonadetes bacterium T265]